VGLPVLPDDPNDWSDEEWIAWLEAGDAENPVDNDRPVLPSWRKGPVALQFLAASMTAVGEAIYGKKEQPAIVIQAPGDPGEDDGLDVHLDHDHPEESVAIIRRWRIEQRGDEEQETIEEHEDDARE
jgi:hypothetical protein